MNLFFKTIRYKNILSTGNTFTEISLCGSKSNLIIGENGAGKSTILDAISYALYGKHFRKITLDQLINATNKKGLLVEIEFNSGKNEIKVVRGKKPDVFEIWENGVLRDRDSSYQQHLEENLLGISKKSFEQIVVMGKANYKPFMELEAKAKREFIEDLLDISMFTKMNLLLKDKMNTNKNAILDLEKDKSHVEQKLSIVKKHDSNMKVAKEDELKRVKNEYKLAKQKAEQLESDIRNCELEVKTLYEKVVDDRVWQHRRDKLKDMLLENKLGKDGILKEMSFLKENDTCPTCKQDIDSDFKKGRLSEQEDRVSRLCDKSERLDEKLILVDNEIDVINKTKDEIQKLERKILSSKASLSAAQSNMESYKKEYKRVQSKDDIKEDYSSDIAKYEQELTDIKSSLHDLYYDKEVYTHSHKLLNDKGIKSLIIKEYTPKINEFVNDNLAHMNMFLEFVLDETFKETIKSRNRDKFTYYSFSEGEKLRINLALLMSWRDISKLKSSIKTNLLIMDEIFDSSMDITGVEDYLSLINGLTEDTNVFIISHRGEELYDKFDNIIEFKNERGFSYIVE